MQESDDGAVDNRRISSSRSNISTNSRYEMDSSANPSAQMSKLGAPRTVTTVVVA